MASVLKVDSIEPANSVTGLKGMPIEVLSSVCDGSTVNVLIGSYTFQNVTTQQVTTRTYTDITGSVISYLPPSGTSRVIYTFHCNEGQGAASGGHVLLHHKFFIDSVEVEKARKTTGGYNYHYGNDIIHSWTINCAADSNDATKGQFTSWTSLKELKWQVRDYSSSYKGNIHGTTYWDGASSDEFSMPRLTITAIR